MDTVHLWEGKPFKIIIVISVILIFVLSTGVIYLYSLQNINVPPRAVVPTRSQTDLLPQQNQTYSSPPPVKFNTYISKTSSPSLPSHIFSYRLKITVSLEDVRALAQKLGLRTIIGQETKRMLTFTNETESDKRGALIFDTETGGFEYHSFSLLRPQVSIQGQPALATAQSFLTELFPNDQTLSCTTTYQKKGGEPFLTYVECHRDLKNLTSMPILSAIGVLNIPEEIPLTTLTSGKSTKDMPDDDTIINTTDNTDGKARPNDFNTITFAINSQTNGVVSVTSSLRWIEQTELLTSTDLLSPKEALKEIKTSQSDFSLTIPAGRGTVDFAKVYKGGRAFGEVARITDYLLTYLEKPAPSSQSYLIPMYLIRGVTTLESGYNVRFVQTIPATKKKLSFLSPSSGQARLQSRLNREAVGGQVAGETARDTQMGDRGQKQGGFFNDTPTPGPSPTPTFFPGTPSPTPCPVGTTLENGSCIPLHWGVATPTPPPSECNTGGAVILPNKAEPWGFFV